MARPRHRSVLAKHALAVGVVEEAHQPRPPSSGSMSMPATSPRRRQAPVLPESLPVRGVQRRCSVVCCRQQARIDRGMNFHDQHRRGARLSPQRPAHLQAIHRICQRHTQQDHVAMPRPGAVRAATTVRRGQHPMPGALHHRRHHHGVRQVVLHHDHTRHTSHTRTIACLMSPGLRR